MKMSFTVGQKCWTPDSETMGQGVITEIGIDNDVRVAHIDIHGRKHEVWFDGSVVQAAPTKEQREVQASNTFRAAHLKANDFNPCKANVDMMTQFIRRNGFPWDAEHLEIAFTALKSKLAPVAAPVPKKEETPMETRPAVPAVTPSAPAFRLTKAQVRDASKEQMREWMADEPKGAVAALEALGIKVLRGTWEQIRASRK